MSGVMFTRTSCLENMFLILYWNVCTLMWCIILRLAIYIRWWALPECTCKIVFYVSEFSRRRSHKLSNLFTSENVWLLVIATPNVWSPWNFQRLISVPLYKNVYLGILISVTQGQVNFAASPLQVNGRKMKGASFERKPFEALNHRVTGRPDIMSWNIVTSDPSPCRQGHFRSWKITSSFWQ